MPFDGRVPIERPDVPSGFALRGNLGDVAVTVRGPAGIADHLSVADFHATLDLAGIDSGQGPRDAKVVVTVSNDAVKVVDRTPPTVSVRLERITSRTLAVQTRLANDPPKGSQAGSSPNGRLRSRSSMRTWFARSIRKTPCSTVRTRRSIAGATG